MLLKAADFSHHQPHNLNARTVASVLDFIVLRAEYGVTTDREFARWWDAFDGLLPRSAYQYLIPEQGVRLQAEWLCELLSYGTAPELACALDVEQGSPSAESLLEWLAYVELHTGKTPLVYGSSSFLDALKLPSEFARYPLWLADYRATPIVPRPWDDWTWLQHTSKGTLPGVTGNVDLDWGRRLA